MLKTFIQKKFRPTLKGEKLYSPEVKENLKSKETVTSRVSAIVCAHAKDDNSQKRAIENNIVEGQGVPIVFLCYDDIGELWNFSFDSREFLIYTKDQVIEVIGLYNRPHVPSKDHSKYFQCFHFFCATELWKGGKNIGCYSNNYYNSSKALQLSTTIAKTVNEYCCKTINIDTPASYFIKGNEEWINDIIKFHKNVIVKSSSGIRSKVVNQEVFLQWDLCDVNNLPTFFQEQIVGMDVRIHVLENYSVGCCVKFKEGVDYRYVKKDGFSFFAVNDDLKKFCLLLSTSEGLSLSGIDFIYDDNRDAYFCLECNPNPGWAGFHRSSGEEHFLVKALIEELKSYEKNIAIF